jgi:hypothetical protein
MSTAQGPRLDEAVWYYQVGVQQVGPVSLEVLMAMARSGGLQPATNVWRKGMGSWVPAYSVPELTGVVAQAPPMAYVPMPRQEAALGLNKDGIILFIILLIVCVPLCWLPWTISSMRANG